MNPASLRRIWVLTQSALQEAAHLRLAWVLGLVAGLFAAGGGVLLDFNFGGEEPRFIADYARGTLHLWGTVLAIMLGGSLYFGALERRTLPLLLVRGVARGEWLTSQLLAVWVALMWLTLAIAICLWGGLRWHGQPVELAAVLRALGPGVGQLYLVATIMLAMCTISRHLFLAAVLSLGLALAAQLAPIIDWARQHTDGVGRFGWILLGVLLPDFPRLETLSPVRALVSVGSYVAVYFGGAILAFSRREL
jgi:ABC-type transport system involved in multi-copper enzyme maturation permease subunit